MGSIPAQRGARTACIPPHGSDEPGGAEALSHVSAGPRTTGRRRRLPDRPHQSARQPARPRRRPAFVTGRARRLGRARPAAAGQVPRIHRPVRVRRGCRRQRTRHQRGRPRGHHGRSCCAVWRAAAATEPAALVIEVSDHHPSRAVRSDTAAGPATSTPRTSTGAACTSSPPSPNAGASPTAAGAKPSGPASRVDAGGPPRTARRPPRRTSSNAACAPPGYWPPPRSRTPRGPDRDWVNRGALSFLAEASDLLAGQFDEDMIAALAGQLLVPRLADWCAIWLDEDAGGPLRRAPPGPGLAREGEPPSSRCGPPWRRSRRSCPPPPAAARCRCPGPRRAELGTDGAALGVPPGRGRRDVGALLIGRADVTRIPDEMTGLVEDFVRRVALAIGAARQYTRQATISRVLQRGLLPSRVAEIPGIDSAFVYEPSNEALAGGDFYDVFPGADGRWCFALGDVQGSGPEAAVVTGLARPWLRLLAREGLRGARGARPAQPAARGRRHRGGRGGGPPRDGGARSCRPTARRPASSPSCTASWCRKPTAAVRCTLASAGHPLPLLLRPDGSVRAAAPSRRSCSAWSRAPATRARPST